MSLKQFKEKRIKYSVQIMKNHSWSHFWKPICSNFDIHCSGIVRVWKMVNSVWSNYKKNSASEVRVPVEQGVGWKCSKSIPIRYSTFQAKQTVYPDCKEYRNVPISVKKLGPRQQPDRCTFSCFTLLNTFSKWIRIPLAILFINSFSIKILSDFLEFTDSFYRFSYII